MPYVSYRGSNGTHSPSPSGRTSISAQKSKSRDTPIDVITKRTMVYGRSPREAVAYSNVGDCSASISVHANH